MLEWLDIETPAWLSWLEWHRAALAELRRGLCITLAQEREALENLLGGDAHGEPALGDALVPEPG